MTADGVAHRPPLPLVLPPITTRGSVMTAGSVAHCPPQPLALPPATTNAKKNLISHSLHTLAHRPPQPLALPPAATNVEEGTIARVEAAATRQRAWAPREESNNARTQTRFQRGRSAASIARTTQQLLQLTTTTRPASAYADDIAAADGAIHVAMWLQPHHRRLATWQQLHIRRLIAGNEEDDDTMDDTEPTVDTRDDTRTTTHEDAIDVD